MSRQIIDAHIHLDMYEEEDRLQILSELEENDVTSIVAVSNDFASSVKQLELSKIDRRIKPAVGYHPEQALPSECELSAILQLIDERADCLAAIGEVGLPYYSRREQPDLDVVLYKEVLECFVRKADEYNLPIVLHTVYEDAEMVCEMLEQYSISKAHFHWFKGDDIIVQRILSNGYMISVTPEVTYRKKIQHIVKQVPLTQLMVETDGPWPFEYTFKGKLTHPSMMHESMNSIARVKGVTVDEAYKEIYETTQRFFCI
ncbi:MULTISPECIES: TatD family hydrolase [unclassified Sporosarcina]|uniref:TatD family hydrolase n=1 Tax=unclassified Sporosarcina TaxID=2647733 RepID=UPI001E6095A4|nr:MULTISPECIES: TatD family hydrolase [unclassified Sporosarcina]